MPRNRPPFFNPQHRPNPEKNKPAAAAAIPMSVAPERNQNASALIYALPMYISHALIGLVLRTDPAAVAEQAIELESRWEGLLK